MGYTYLFSVDVFIIFGYILKSGIAGSYGSSSFSFLKNLHTVYTMATPVYIPTNSARAFSTPSPHLPFSPHSAFIVCGLFDDGCSDQWYLTVVLICISIIISDVGHGFMFLLAICVSSLEESLFTTSAHF